MTIETLQYVYAAYKYGSYKEASYALSVTYSVVAKQVARAEEEFGIRIFERASKSKEMQLTKSGQAVIKEIKTILEAYHRIQNIIGELDWSFRKKISIRYGYYIICEEEMDIMHRFMSKHPEIILSQKPGTYEENKAQLELGNVDGIFRAYIGSDSEERVRRSFPDTDYNFQLISRECNFHLLMSENNPLAAYNELTMADIKEIINQTFILMDTSEGRVRETPPYLSRYMGSAVANMKVRYIDSSNLPIVPHLLAEGNYVFPTARRCTRPPAGICAVPLSDWNSEVSLYFIYKKSHTNSLLLDFKRVATDYSMQ